MRHAPQHSIPHPKLLAPCPRSRLAPVPALPPFPPCPRSCLAPTFPLLGRSGVPQQLIPEPIQL
eukprot:364930-Chlamydomonas_euryale.AAC.25